MTAPDSPLRAIVDANPFISYLLSRTPEASAMGAVMAAAIEGVFSLLFTPAIGQELRATVAGRPDLARMLTTEAVEGLLAHLGVIAEFIPSLSGVFPKVGRDRKDDYLIAHAIAARADYLITWDKDLRDLGQVDGVRIVTPPAFLRVLREAGLLPR